MIRTINLDILTEENLNKTVSEFFQTKCENNCDVINTHINSFFKIIHKQFIIIGKILICNDTFLQYNGYYITHNTISKSKNAVTTIEDIIVSVITKKEYEDYSNKIEKILSEINQTSEFLIEVSANKLQNIQGVAKPNKTNCLSLTIDSIFIKNFANTKLKKLRDNALDKYNILLEKYKTSYHENKKLIGKYFITPYTIGYISDFDKNSSKLICEQFWLEENKLVQVCQPSVIEQCYFYDNSFKLYSKMQNTLINIHELFYSILNEN